MEVGDRSFADCLMLSGVEAKANGAHGRKVLKSVGAPLHGIVAHLARECGGNVHNNDVVVVTVWPPCSDATFCSLKTIVDYGSHNYHQSQDKPNQLICIDLRVR